MPIALVPEGFTLKKVTKAQEDALKDHRKHEDFKAFLSSSGSGKGLGLGALGIVLLLILPFMILAFIKRYGEQNPNTTFYNLPKKPTPQLWQVEPRFMLNQWQGFPKLYKM